MKKIFKILLFVILLVFVSYSAIWYYVTNQIVSTLRNYENQDINLSKNDNSKTKNNLSLKFTKVRFSGFPLSIAFTIHGLTESNDSIDVECMKPVRLGYNLYSSKLFLEYSGDITARYKVKGNFGTRMTRDVYRITLDFPFNKTLVSNIIKITRKELSPVALIANFNNLQFHSENMKIYDLDVNNVLYDQLHEKATIRLDHSSKLIEMYNNPEQSKESQDDNKSNYNFYDYIPKNYTIEYSVQTTDFKDYEGALPVSIIYGFHILPSSTKLSIDTQFNIDINDMMNNKIGVKGILNYDSPYFGLSNCDFNISRHTDLPIVTYSNTMDTKLRIKQGFFAKIFDKYDSYRGFILHNMKEKNTQIPANKISDEIDNIIANSKSLNLDLLENGEYNIGCNIDFIKQNNNLKLDIHYLYALSDISGFKLSNHSHFNMNNLLQRDPLFYGTLMVKNYDHLIDFSAAYMMNKLLPNLSISDEVKSKYVNVTRRFIDKIKNDNNVLDKIYNNNTVTSLYYLNNNDSKNKIDLSNNSNLSINYALDFQNLGNSKLGKINISNLNRLYMEYLTGVIYNLIDVNEDIERQLNKLLPANNKKGDNVSIIKDKVQKKLKERLYDKVIKMQEKIMQNINHNK